MSAQWIGRDHWRALLGKARDVVRQALVTHQLAEHLPEPREGLEALDVGCGQGTQMLELARRGYRVTGVDISEDLLAIAEAARDGEPPEVRGRVRLLVGDLHRLADVLDHPYDVVCCHGLLMYQPSLHESAELLATVTVPGGLLSVLTRNRFGIAMRAGMTGDWPGALAGFEARHYDNRSGILGARGDEPEEVVDAFAQAGVALVHWYGVKLFTDHWGDVEPPEDLEALIEAEAQAGSRDPYRQLGSLTHFIGRKA
jgi:S-adenosylmethionine-dependent methyltransferase